MKFIRSRAKLLSLLVRAQGTVFAVMMGTVAMVGMFRSFAAIAELQREEVLALVERLEEEPEDCRRRTAYVSFSFRSDNSTILRMASYRAFASSFVSR